MSVLGCSKLVKNASVCICNDLTHAQSLKGSKDLSICLIDYCE